MWQEITKEQYLQLQQQTKMRPLSGYTDMDGTCPFGNGRPQISTVWGIDVDTELLRCEMQKESRDDAAWVETFYAAVSP